MSVVDTVAHLSYCRAVVIIVAVHHLGFVMRVFRPATKDIW